MTHEKKQNNQTNRNKQELWASNVTPWWHKIRGSIPSTKKEHSDMEGKDVLLSILASSVLFSTVRNPK